MASPLKRLLDTTKRSISPPPLKRRKRQPTSSNNSIVESEAPSTTHEVNIAPPPTASSLTIYSWNVNRILPLLQRPIIFTSAATFPLRAFLSSHQFPSLLCLQEVKIAPFDLKTHRHVSIAANSGNKPREPTYTVLFSLPRDKYNATGFGGKVHGIATLIRDDLLLRHDITTHKPDWDLEGRVLIHEFQDLPLVVVNGYWVNGTANPYRDPQTGQVSGTRHDHKLRFHAHMLALTKKYEAAAKQVVLIGDMNIAPSRIDGHPNLRTHPVQHVLNRDDFNDKFLDVRSDDGMRGVDVFRSLHGQKKAYTYHGRSQPWGKSCDRVDLAVCSRELVEHGAVVGCDICDTPVQRGHSDHVPLWIAIDLNMVKKGSTGSQTTREDEIENNSSIIAC